MSRKIDSLSLDPRHPGVKKLSVEDGVYSIRDGDFRIIYSIDDRKVLILLLSVGDRRDIYKHSLNNGSYSVNPSPGSLIVNVESRIVDRQVESQHTLVKRSFTRLPEGARAMAASANT